jgi:hypothetical protein
MLDDLIKLPPIETEPTLSFGRNDQVSFVAGEKKRRKKKRKFLERQSSQL